MLKRSRVKHLSVAILILIYSEVVSFILIIEPRYLNFGTSSILVSSIRTGPIPLGAITFVFVSLIFSPKLSLCLVFALAIFPSLPLILLSMFIICKFHNVSPSMTQPHLSGIILHFNRTDYFYQACGFSIFTLSYNNVGDANILFQIKISGPTSKANDWDATSRSTMNILHRRQIQ